MVVLLEAVQEEERGGLGPADAREVERGEGGDGGAREGEELLAGDAVAAREEVAELRAVVLEGRAADGGLGRGGGVSGGGIGVEGKA